MYVAREIAAVESAATDAATASSAFKMDALVDVIVRKYAPLPGNSLGFLVNRLQHGAPQWVKERAAALARAKQRLGHVRAFKASNGFGRWRKGRSQSAGCPTTRCVC